MFWNPADNVSGFYGIPRNMTGIGWKLKEAGYSTHFLGKWDAGMATPEHTPLGRGFDTFLGTLESISGHWTMDHAQEAQLLDVCGNRFKDFSLYNATYRGGVSPRLEEELGCKASKWLEGVASGATATGIVCRRVAIKRPCSWNMP